MEPDGPVSRAERTFWTVWGYISGAVNRLFRAEPANIVSNDQDSLQESAVDSEPAYRGHVADGDESATGVYEEQPLQTPSMLNFPRTVVAWESCTNKIDLIPDEVSLRSKTQLSKPSEEGEGTEEEKLSRAGNYDAELLFAKDKRAKEDTQGDNRDQVRLYTGRQNETKENDEYEERVNTRSLGLIGDLMMTEDGEGSQRKAGAQEETKRVLASDDCEKMYDTIAKTQVKEEDDEMHHEEQQLEAEGIGMKLCAHLSLEEESGMHIEESRVQRKDTDTAVMAHEEVENGDGELKLASENVNKPDKGEREVENQSLKREEFSGDNRVIEEDTGFTALHFELQNSQHNKSGSVPEEELIIAGQELMMAHRSDKAEDEESTKNEMEQGAVIEEEYGNEAANNQTIDEVPEQEDHIENVTEDGQEEGDILNEHVKCSEVNLQIAKTEMHTAEYTDGEKEDVAKDPEVQAETTEVDDVETGRHGTVTNEKIEASVDDTFFDKGQAGGERPSSEEGSKESYMAIACTATSVAVKLESGTGQEKSTEFKKIPLRICEGRAVVLQERNYPTCEETQEGVPEYNNESQPDENTTQRFLEEGDSEEIQQTTQLQEGVESKELESLQNSTGTDYLLVREQMEEEQENTEYFKKDFDMVNAESPQETEKPLAEKIIQEPGLLFVEEEGTLLIDSMMAEIEQSAEEFESDIRSTDEMYKTTKGDVREMTGAVRAEEVAADETLEFLEAKVHGMTETSFFQVLVDATNSERNSSRKTSLLKGIADFEFLKQNDEPESKLPEQSTVEMQDSRMSMEAPGVEAEEEAAAEDNNEMEILDLQVVRTAAEQTTVRNKIECALIVDSELDRAVEMVNQVPDAEAADESITTESKPKDQSKTLTQHLTEIEESSAEDPISERQDVIEEEILDLWIQTMAEDTGKQQELPDLGSQTDMEREPSNEDQDEISSFMMEKDKWQLMETEGSESVSDTKMSSSTAESGFSEQSLCEWRTQNSERQLLKSTSIRSIEGRDDILDNVLESADLSELIIRQPLSGSQDIPMEEKAETRLSCLQEEESINEAGFHPNSGEVRLVNQDSDGSQEGKTEKDTGSQKYIAAEDVERTINWEESKEEDVKSLREISAKKLKIEDQPLEVKAPESPDEIQHTEPVRSRSGSEVSSEGGNGSTQSSPQDDTLPGLDRAEVAEQPRKKSEDEIEVDESALDFTAQKSRISVKNPLVRPPKDPRSLLNMPSLDPTPAIHPPVKVPAGVPLGGLGIGIKLPGLGAGLAVLRKTQRAVRDENSPDNQSKQQEPETKPEEKSETPKQDEAQPKHKWMPPGRPGFGNPLMSELKTKLKKTTKE